MNLWTLAARSAEVAVRQTGRPMPARLAVSVLPVSPSTPHGRGPDVLVSARKQLVAENVGRQDRLLRVRDHHARIRERPKE